MGGRGGTSLTGDAARAANDDAATVITGMGWGEWEEDGQHVSIFSS